jgi:hypothetical protein
MAYYIYSKNAVYYCASWDVIFYSSFIVYLCAVITGNISAEEVGR